MTLTSPAAFRKLSGHQCNDFLVPEDVAALRTGNTGDENTTEQRGGNVLVEAAAAAATAAVSKEANQSVERLITELQ